MDPGDCTIRLYRSGDEEGITKLLNDVFAPFPRFDIECSSIDHWKWKFIDNPNYALVNNLYPHAVGEVGGKIIGVTHGMLYRTKIGESTYLSRKGADVAVLEEYRGMRVYTRINNLKREAYQKIGVNFGYSLTANPILINRKRVVPQFLFPHGIKYLIKIRSVEGYFKHSMKKETGLKKISLKIGVYGAKLLNKISSFYQQPSKNTVEIIPITKFDERINLFYDKVKAHHSFIVEKTKDYMNWRYCDKRGGDFRTWLAIEEGEIAGLLVLRVNRLEPNFTSGYFMDLLALDGRLDVADALIAFASDWFAKSGVDVVYAQIVSGHPYERLYSKYGFLDSRVKPHLTYTNISVGPADLSEFTNSAPGALHYPYGEGDAI